MHTKHITEWKNNLSWKTPNNRNLLLSILMKASVSGPFLVLVYDILIFSFLIAIHINHFSNITKTSLNILSILYGVWSISFFNIRRTSCSTFEIWIILSILKILISSCFEKYDVLILVFIYYSSDLTLIFIALRITTYQKSLCIDQLCMNSVLIPGNS